MATTGYVRGGPDSTHKPTSAREQNRRLPAAVTHQAQLPPTETQLMVRNPLATTHPHL